MAEYNIVSCRKL